MGGRKMKTVNGYRIETAGGGSFVKRWIVWQNSYFVRIFFKFREAKIACLTGDFSKGMKKDIY